ncbi:MAG: PKD domain-containing protein [Saprospiraceae bacterium]|nr:PKD domain-containing protein [Saprospiraceae bacterium]
MLLNTVAGTLNPARGTVTSNAAGAAFSVKGSNPTITYPGTISKTGSTGDVVSIANTTGNTNIMFSAAVSGDNMSTGVTLSNANSNVTFLSITLGNSGARLTNIPIEINGGGSSNTYNLGVVSAFSNNTTTFSATNADGTINCSNTSTLNATNGPAINIDGPVGLTTLGLTFVSVNVSTSSTNGITIKDTNGNFTINGTGTTNGSGGTLQNISNRGIELSGMTTMTSITLKNMTLNDANTVDSGSGCDNSSNTGCNAAIHLNGVANLTLDNVDIDDAAEQGINGISVSNLIMNNCIVTNGGDASSALDVGEDNVRLVGLSGTCSISNCIFSFPARKNFAVLNTDVNLNQITFSNCTFSDTQGRPFNFGDSGIEFDLIGNSTTNIDVDNCTFTRHKTEGIQVLPSTNGTMTTLDIEGCSFDNDPSNIVDGRAIELFPDGTSVLKFNIANNTKIKGKGGPIITMNAEDNTVVDGFITGNNTSGGKSGIIGGGTGSPGSAILISAQENCSARIQVENNVISNVGGLDNTILAEALGGTGNLHVKILNNTITTESRYINIQSGVSGDLGTNTVCAHIANNACSGTTSTTIVRGRQVTAGHTLQFQGAGAGAMETDRLANNWNTNGNTPMATAATVSVGVATMFGYGATCSSPSYTPSIVADPVAEMITDNTVIDPTEGEVTTTTVESEDIENIAKTPSTPEEEPITQAAVKPDKGSNSPVEKMAPDVTVGPLTLPEGKNVIIKFRVTVNTPPLANCQISNQGLVMFDGGSVMTDDPAVGGATDPTVTPFNPLVADFNGTPLTGCVPLEVNFTDASTSGGTVNSWAWDVDNNSITDYTTQNPMHTYTTPGMYTVKLTVMDNLGCTDTETKTNYVNAAEPEVNIAVAPMSVPENMGTPLVFTVTRTGSTDCELTVPFTIMGTATNGTDYPLVSTLSFTIPAGMTTAMLSITPTDDNIVEANETIIVTLTDGANYSVGMNNLATGTITNDDQATLSINSVSNAEGRYGHSNLYLHGYFG